jgi:CBS domain-containing protein
MTMARIDGIMQTDGPRLTPDMPIRRSAALLAESGAAAAPVLDESGTLVGILTEKDCFRPALHASYYQAWKGAVADHMSSPVRSLPTGTDLASAASAFVELPHRVLAVTDGERYLGLLRRSDVFVALLRLG